MTKANITQYDSTPSNNADINDINIAENCPASNINNAIRELMAHLKNVDTGSQALTALSVTGDLTVGDGHTIGDQSSNDNLLIKSSSGENIELDSNNGSHIFKKNGTENFRVNDDGEVRVTDNIVLSTAGKGIHLGVTSATASNLLDDYEEGEWTPQYEPASGSFGGSYLTQKGRYTKVGRLVTVEFQLVANFSNNTQSGTVKIIGLPFTVSAHSSGGSFHGLNIAQSTRFTGDPPRGGQIQENSTKIFLWKTVEATGAGSDVASLTTSNFILSGGNPNNLVASITYFAD